MDLIINFTEFGLKREMGKEVDKKWQTKIDRFFGNRKWRTVYEKSPPRERMRNLIDLYRNNLRELGYKDVVRGDEISQLEPLMRNTKQAGLYRLLFASKSERGIDFWIKITRRDVSGQMPLF